MVLYLIGAYGRDYNTAVGAKDDWEAGKDFKIVGGGPYCSVRDVEFMKEKGFNTISILTISTGRPVYTRIL